MKSTTAPKPAASPGQPLPPAERLLCELNRARPDPDTADWVRATLAGGLLDWDRVRELAILNAVVPLTLHRLEALGLLDAVPASVREAWAPIEKDVRERNQARSAWAGKLLRALADAGIETIVLKGSLFADTLYRDRAYKKMNDMDILVRRGDAKDAIRILKAVGFNGVGDLFGKDELAASSHHTPPYVSDDLGCVVGLHWGLSAPGAPWQPDVDAIWARRAPAEVAGAPAFRMSWEQNLLHLCVHLPFFKIGLRELADVYNVALHAENGRSLDWTAFDAEVSRWKAEDPAYRVLALADGLVELKIPPALLARWRAAAAAFTVADTEARLAEPAVILQSRSTLISKIEKAYVIFRLSEKYSERAQAWAGMWAFLLWPKAAEVKKLAGKPGLRGLRALARARAETPGRVWRAMAREHGNLPLAAITAINAGKMARDTLLRPFSTDGKSLREHPAAKLLEVLE